MLKSFLTTLLAYINSGLENVSTQEYQSRIMICFRCDKRTRDWKCSECGCNLELKAKWAVAKCPLEKWNKIPLTMVQNENQKLPCGCQ